MVFLPYEIPQNLKYQEKIVFDLTFNQLAWLSVFGCLAAIVFLKTNLPFYLKVVISLFLFLLGVGFAFFGFTNHLGALKTYKDSIRQAGYFDSRLKAFVDVEKIEDDAIFLRSGGMRAILQVIPINFGLLSSHEQEAIIKAYSNFLNSLDFPVQIVMRTVNLSLDNYMVNLEQKARKSENKQLIEQFDSFREFVKSFIENNAVKNRLFYLVIPYSPGNNANPLNDIMVCLQNLFSTEKQKTSFEINKENALNQLSIRVKLCSEKLKKSNLLSKRLDSHELVSLLASFFEGFVEAQNNYFFPITLLEKFSKQKTENKFVSAHGTVVSVKNAGVV